MLHKIKRNIFLSIGFAGIIYLGFMLYADFQQLTALLSSISLGFALLVLSLSFINYLARFSKWHYYLRVIDVRINMRDSFSVFMSGLIMSVTPGKMGELLKSYLVKQITGDSISRTAPIVFAERITDFLSLVFIAIIGAYAFNFGKEISIGVGIFFIGLVFLLSRKDLMYPILHALKKLRFVEKHFSKLIDAYESSYALLRPKPLFLMFGMSIVSWFFECLGYFIILRKFDLNVSLLWASFSYAFATIVGAITMLPGGLGVTEGSLTVMLVNLLKPLEIKEVAVATTFLIRIATLWFAVFVGIVSVFFYQRRFGKVTFDNEEST